MLSCVTRDLKRIAVVLTVALSLVTAMATPSFAQTVFGPDNPDLLVDAVVAYRVDLDAGSVLAEANYLIANTSTDQRVTEFDEMLPSSVFDVVATSRGRVLDAQKVEAAAGVSRWRIQLPSVLRPGREVELKLSWAMAGESPAGRDAYPLVNAAYVSFPVVAVGSPGSLHAVEVTLPQGFQVMNAPGFGSTSDTEVVRLVDNGSLNPYVPISIVAVRSSALVPRRLADLKVAVDVLGWPGDARWSTDVGDAASSIVTQLTGWLGAPAVDAFEIREGPLEAYPGVIPGEVVERTAILVIDSQADPGPLGRQLAKAWLDSSLPDVAWFAPAAVGVFGTRAAQLFDPLAVGPDETAAGFDPAAYSVVDSLVSEIGAGTVAEMIPLVTSGVFTYPGPGDSTVAPLPADWRTLLDSLEGSGGSIKAADLFRRVMTEPSDVTELDARALARADFVTLEKLAAGWELPIWVREPLATWDFTTYEARREAVAGTLAQRDSLAELAAAAGLDVGDFVRVSFEGETRGMTATVALIDDQRSALESVTEAEHVVDSNSGLISRIGLIGTDVVMERGKIRAAFEAGEFERARELSVSLIKTIEGSNAVGVLRVFIPAVATLAIGSAVVEIERRRRRRRSGRASVEEST